MSVLEAVPVRRVTAEAKRTAATVSPGRVLLTVLTGVFFVVGWLAAKTWFALVWMVTAVRVGWTVAHEARQSGEARGPTR